MNIRPLLFKILPVAVLLTAGIFLAATTVQRANANIGSVFASPTSIASSGTTAITVNGTDDSGNVTVSVANAITATLTLSACSGGNGSIVLSACQQNSAGSGTSTFVLNTGPLDPDAAAQSLSLTLTLTATCTVNQAITVNVVDGGSIGGSTTVLCSGAAAGWISVPASIACGGTATVTASPPGALTNSIVSFVASTGTFNPANAVYNGSSASSTYTAPTTAQPVTFTVSDGAINGTAQVPITCSTGSAISVSAAPNSLNCGSSSFITAVTNLPGTTVSLTTTIGSLAPTSAVDQGGGVLAVLTAPQSQSGTATITATGGGGSGSTEVTVACSAAAPTAVPPTAVPAQPAQPVAVLRPPNTGDGGLSRGEPAWRLALGFGLIGLSLTAGAFVAMRKRA